jgi:hypothetical protein
MQTGTLNACLLCYEKEGFSGKITLTYNERKVRRDSMKISNEFALREIAGNFIVVPVGEKAVSFKAMITLNETGSFLWRQLEEEKTEQDLLNALLEEYDIDSETANIDIHKFLAKLKAANIL